MNINDFVVPTTAGGEYGFQAENKATACALRKLADDLDSNRVLIQGVRLSSVAKLDEYPGTALRLIFYEKMPAKQQPVIKELYADAGRFPVDVAATGQHTDAVGTGGCKATVSARQ